MLDPIEVAPEKFAMSALPGLARYLFSERLDDYVLRVIDLSRKAELPLLKKLDKFSENELMALGRQSHGEILESLANGTIHLHITENVRRWISNQLEVIESDEVVAEDVTLSAFIKRRALQSFVPVYTQDAALQQQLRDEIDDYTTQEELISYNTYMKLQQQQLNEANEELQFQESLLLEAQEISELGSYFTDYVNPENSVITPQITKILGQDRAGEELFFSRVHPDDAAEFKRIYDQALEQGGPFEYTFRYVKDGIEKKLHSRGIVVKQNGAVAHVKGTLRDVTQNDLLIKKLTQSEALHKEAQRLTHLGNWSWDVGNNTIDWSDEMYRIYGLEPQSELITYERFLSMIHPDHRDRRIAEVTQALETGIANDYTLHIVRPNGDVRVLRGFGSIEHAADGTPLRLTGTCQDITEEYHLKNELIALNHALSVKNAELLASNKELESFNYIASHDLQEPLRKIQLYIEKIMYQTGELPPQAITALEKVVSSASRMRTLIHDLMEFSQISLSETVLEEIPGDNLVDEALEPYADAVAAGQVVIRRENLPMLHVIRFQFVQLLGNIIGNAIKYGPGDKHLIINISAKTVTAREMEFEGASGKYVRLTIADNGIGFDPAQRDNIFELFRRLHGPGTYSGTGIGLAICKKIMQNHKGFISADSTPGCGAKFHIYIPAQD